MAAWPSLQCSKNSMIENPITKKAAGTGGLDLEPR
jgi:hypothetical protein